VGSEDAFFRAIFLRRGAGPSVGGFAPGQFVRTYQVGTAMRK